MSPTHRTLRIPILVWVLVLAAGAPHAAGAQTFTRVTDASNPIVSDPGSGGFAGSCWIDADADGWPDLYVGARALYRNLGGGTFTRVLFADSLAGLGSSWADYDNDGDADLFVAGSLNNNGRGSHLFRNDGGSFTRIEGGAIGDSAANVGWACAWGDYDADGFVDLVIAQAQGFTGSGPNKLLRNVGDGTFAYDLTTDVTVGTGPYTVPQWCDFDLDGDLDLAIGAGPANGLKGPDYFYRNLRVEGGAPPLLDRITTGLLASETRDGQVVNWPDYDNDGDLDCFITNYRNSANHLYRNDGGTYVKMTGVTAGPIASDVGWNLANLWHDFDNDGDLDCFVTRTSTFANRYYRNEGDGTFAAIAMGTLTSANGSTAVAADYDRDGDVDLYLSAATIRGLYVNDAPPENHWLEVELVGTKSNRSAIGAKVRVQATIAGTPVTLLREVSSQNSFNGHSSFTQHFGLGDATSVEELRVEWPSGLVESFDDVPADSILRIVEGDSTPTPALAALVGWRATVRGVELEWYGSLLDAAGALVYRRSDADPVWRAIGSPRALGAHYVAYLDADDSAGRWAYRLGKNADANEWLTEEAWIEVAPATAFRARSLVALAGHIELEITLPSDGPVRAEVFDASGRRRHVEDLGTREAGTHRFSLGAEALVPGIYWVRLSHGGAKVSARAIVLGGGR